MPNESAKIILAATHSKLTKVRDALAIEDGINALKVGFQFRTSDWDNTVKIAQFTRGCATPTTSEEDIISVMLDENNECDVPHEVLENKGMFSVGVWGINETIRIPSNWMYYRIADGCFAQGRASLEPIPTVYEQILIGFNNKSDKDHNHDEKYAQLADIITQDDIETQINNIIDEHSLNSMLEEVLT